MHRRRRSEFPRLVSVPHGGAQEAPEFNADLRLVRFDPGSQSTQCSLRAPLQRARLSGASQWLDQCFGAALPAGGAS
eukprot:6841269-Pyramimonas_sp.AAC.1